MNRLTALADKLTPAQIDDVANYAEALIARSMPAKAAPKYVNVDAIAGMFAGLAPDKSDVELVHEANEAMSKKYDKYFR